MVFLAGLFSSLPVPFAVLDNNLCTIKLEMEALPLRACYWSKQCLKVSLGRGGRAQLGENSSDGLLLTRHFGTLQRDSLAAETLP